jgi:hypothetical protein
MHLPSAVTADESNTLPDYYRLKGGSIDDCNQEQLALLLAFGCKHAGLRAAVYDHGEITIYCPDQGGSIEH